jgi:hypothetical protein
MTIDIGLVFSAIGLARSVAEFTGLLDSVETKIDRLLKSELNAGLRALEQAAHASSEQASLLREARASFNRAVSLEAGYRGVVALLALSVCHHWLDDRPNSMRALEEILAINPVTTLKLAIAAGRNEIRENSPAVFSQRMKDTFTTSRSLSEIAQALVLEHPMIRWGMLALSGPARKAYHRKLVLGAVQMNTEASAIHRIQESVARHIDRPISWLKAMD